MYCSIAHRALVGKQPRAGVAGRLAFEPGVELFPASRVHRATHAPDKGEKEKGLNVDTQRLDRLTGSHKT